MAFFCAEEPEASSWPLASSHLMLPALAVGPLLDPPLALRVVRAARREDQGAGDGEGADGRARSRFLR